MKPYKDYHSYNYMKIYLHDTLSKEDKLLEDRDIKMYVCGLTPYDDAHIGHARNFVVFDVLKRLLLYDGRKVFHMQNVTDVEDKIIKRANERGEDALKLAEHYQKLATELMDKLNVLRADIYPKVSEHIPDIIHMVEVLQEKGYAYETETGVYYSVSKFADYGKLSGQSLEEIRGGYRIEPDPTKRDSADFALWKKDCSGPCWDSPWGKGRPGWHIECSAMSLKYAPEGLTIHGGARDLIFPHHENEIAQSEAYMEKPFAKIWVHSGLLTIDGKKMSKSLGNFITLKDALEKWKPMVLRLFFLSAHYSKPLDINEEALKAAEETYNKLNSTYKLLLSLDGDGNTRANELQEERTAFLSALAHNLNLPEALAHVHKASSIINKHGSALDKWSVKIAKLLFDEFQFIFGVAFEGSSSSDKEKLLLDLMKRFRDELRGKKLYELSDKLRDELGNIGYVIMDGKEGTEIRPK